MSHSTNSYDRNNTRLAPLAAPLIIAALLAGCSTDVQRFGHTGSIGSSTAVTPAPVERVERAPLGLAKGPARESVRSPYVNSASYGTTEPARESLYGRSAGGRAGDVITVRTGDTAFSIAQAYGVTVEELAAANGLAYPYHVRLGQELTIPGAGAAPASRAAPVRVAERNGETHTVAQGETLYAISQYYGVDVADLADLNDLDDYASIRIGQTLYLPGRGGARAEGGPLQLASRSVDEDDRAAGTSRILRSRAIEADEESGRDNKTDAARRGATEPLPLPPERAASMFRWPARGRIIARYGIDSNGQRNDGINISVPEGASVKAAENGVVAYAGDELKGYGNLILIRHANDWVTAYAHNSTLLVRRGDTVKRGQIIAKAGQTGSVDQPQLHFEVRQGSKAVDPMPYLEGA